MSLSGPRAGATCRLGPANERIYPLPPPPFDNLLNPNTVETATKAPAADSFVKHGKGERSSAQRIKSGGRAVCDDAGGQRGDPLFQWKTNVNLTEGR